MSDQPLILDYASPRKRSRFRLPAQSTIEMNLDQQENLEVLETLRGKSEAIGGLAFAAFILVTVGAVLVGQVHYSWRHAASVFATALLAVAWGGELWTGLAVINATWRSTRLSVRDGELRVEFFSPLRGTRSYRWPVEQIADVRVAPTFTALNAAALGQLEIRPVNHPGIELFSDHHAEQLNRIARALGIALRPKHTR